MLLFSVRAWHCAFSFVSLCCRCHRMTEWVLVLASLQLQLENLSSLAVDWLYSMYHYSHPPLTERLTAMNKRAVTPQLASVGNKKRD